MTNTIILKPFFQPFISDFSYIPETLPFTSEEIEALDKELTVYEQVYLNPEIERNLISKNELLASFAISKAENSQLTLAEAQDIYNQKKFEVKQKLTQKDHDKLEFFNILKTFRNFNIQPFVINDLTVDLIREIHKSLTVGLDAFKDQLTGFTVYKSGNWRDNNLIRVGKYIPAPYMEIEKGVKELVAWLKNNHTVTGVAVFHTVLYGLHPFNNGNKRVCRVLEHILLRSLNLNKKNLYSTSYYYHKQKERYYKYLLFSLERKNLNHFVAFVQEALVLSMVDVVKTSLEAKRLEFVKKQDLEGQMILVLKPLIKRSEVQFKSLARFTSGKIARQTLVTYLSKAVDQGIVYKRETGRVTYYRFNFDSPEMETLQKWLKIINKRLAFIPDSLKLI